MEGDPDTIDRGQMVKTAAMRTEVFDGFFVCRTSDLTQTHELLVSITVNLHEIHGSLSLSNDSMLAPRETAHEFPELAAKQKDLLTFSVRSVFGMMLAQVHGLGETNIEAILRKYPTPLDLHRVLAGKDKVGSFGARMRKQ